MLCITVNMASRTRLTLLTLALSALGIQAIPNYIGEIDSKWSIGTKLTTSPIAVTVGDPIELTCSSKESGGVAWRYPSRYASDDEAGEYGIVEFIETRSADGKMFYNTIRITNATYRDTGRYRCYCPGMKTHSHSLQHIGGRLIERMSAYVYVSDDRHMFQTEPTKYRVAISGIVGRSVILPCSVTDPTLNTTLMVMRGFNRPTNVKVDGKRIQFDPKLGFIISALSFRDFGFYQCRVTDGMNSQEKNLFLRVIYSNPNVPIPLLSLSKGERVSEGDDINFKCQVPLNSHQLSTITWWKSQDDEPDKQIVDEDGKVQIKAAAYEDICSGSRKMCSFKRRFSLRSSSVKKLTGRMKILNTDLSDSGEYYCKVWSDNLTVNSMKTRVYVQTRRTAPAA